MFFAVAAAVNPAAAAQAAFADIPFVVSLESPDDTEAVAASTFVQYLEVSELEVSVVVVALAALAGAGMACATAVMLAGSWPLPEEMLSAAIVLSAVILPGNGC